VILDVAADRPGDLRQRRRRPTEHRQAHDQSDWPKCSHTAVPFSPAWRPVGWGSRSGWA